MWVLLNFYLFFSRYHETTLSEMTEILFVAIALIEIFPVFTSQLMNFQLKSHNLWGDEV